MSHPIGDALEHELGVIINHGQADVRRVWQHITNRNPLQPYDSPGGAADAAEQATHPGRNPMSVLDTIRTDFAAVLDKAEQDAAKVEKYESEPLVQGILAVLETVPVAREIITPVLDGLAKVAAMTPAAPVADAVPGDPSAPVDPQIQTGVAQ